MGFRSGVRIDARGVDPTGVKAAAALQSLRVKLAFRETAPVNIVVGAPGDSTDEGSGVGNAADGSDRNKSWPSLLARGLRTKLTTTGETNPQPTPNFVPARTVSTVPTGWTFTTPGAAWVTSPSATTRGFSIDGVGQAAPVVGAVATYVTAVGLTDFELMYLRGADDTYSWDVSIDGGAAVRIGGTNDTPGGVEACKTKAFTNLNPATTHTVSLTAVGTNAVLNGILPYYGNFIKGIRVYDLAQHGSNVSQWQAGSTFGFVKAGGNGPSVLTAPTNGYRRLDPDVIIVGGGYNDFKGSFSSPAVISPRALTEYKSGVAAVVAAMRAPLPSKSIPVIYLHKWFPDPGFGTNPYGESWSLYGQAKKELSDADPLGVFVDLSSIMPTVTAAATAFPNMFADTVHGKQPAYQMVSDHFVSILTP